MASARSWGTPQNAAAPKMMRLLWCPVRPKGAERITARRLPPRAAPYDGDVADQKPPKLVAGERETLAASLDDPCRALPGEEAGLRRVLMHLLEETARPAGHADIIRELIDGDTGP